MRGSLYALLACMIACGASFCSYDFMNLVAQETTKEALEETRPTEMPPAEEETPLAEKPAVTFPAEAEVTADNVNLRLANRVAPDVGVIGKVYKGQKVKVLRRVDDWCEVEIPKLTFSWVNMDYLQDRGDGTAEITGDGVNIRASNDTRADILGLLFKGYVVKIADTEGNWARVEALPDATAWVYAEFLKIGQVPLAGEKPVEKPAKTPEQEVQEKFQEAEALYKAELAKDVDKWNFDASLALYKEVRRKASDLLLKSKAADRIIEIGHNMVIKRRLLSIKKMRDDFRKRLQQIEENYRRRMAELKSKKMEEVPLARGIIQKLFIDYLAPATHKLQDDDGSTKFLVYSKKVNLKNYVGKKVKVYGDLEDTDWGRSIIKIDRVEQIE